MATTTARTGPGVLCLLGVLATAGCGGHLGLPEAATAEAGEVVSLWRLLFWLAAAVGAVVVVLIAWCLARYRHRGDTGVPEQVPGHVPLEVFYTLVPLGIVAVLFVVALRADDRTFHLSEQPDLVVDVTGFQWQWRFDYPDHGVSVVGDVDDPLPELVLPVDRVVRFRLTGRDVIHSFFVTGFMAKLDAIPGITREFEVRPVRTGRFPGHCAEFCGLDHARMNFVVRVVDGDDFDRWAERRAGRELAR